MVKLQTFLCWHHRIIFHPLLLFNKIYSLSLSGRETNPLRAQVRLADEVAGPSPGAPSKVRYTCLSSCNVP